MKTMTSSQQKMLFRLALSIYRTHIMQLFRQYTFITWPLNYIPSMTFTKHKTYLQLQSRKHVTFILAQQ